MTLVGCNSTTSSVTSWSPSFHMSISPHSLSHVVVTHPYLPSLLLSHIAVTLFPHPYLPLLSLSHVAQITPTLSVRTLLVKFSLAGGQY
jgi:hypothetical protein